MKIVLSVLLFVASSFAQIHLQTCQTITQPGTYILDNNVSCLASGFAIAAANVTVDLACHVVTYGATPAFSLCDTWYKGLPVGSCAGSHHDTFRLTSTGCKGGIWQDPSSPAFVPAIGAGQSNSLAPGQIDNVIVVVQQTGAVPFTCSWCVPGWNLHDNEFISTVANIQRAGESPLSARSAFHGYSVQFGGGLNQPGAGNQVNRNIFVGFPQGGIYDVAQNSVHADNVMLGTSIYANDYADALTATGQSATGNVVTCVGPLLHCRGMDVEGSNETIAGNMLMVASAPLTLADQGTGPAGCEESGGDGVRRKDYAGKPASTNVVIADNFVVVKAGPCSANAMRLTNLPPQDTGTIARNTFLTIPGAAPDYPLSIEGDRAQITWDSNHFVGSSVFIDWDGVSATIDAGQKWDLLGPTVFDADGHTLPVPSLTILDSISNLTYACSAQSSTTLTVGSLQKVCP